MVRMHERPLNRFGEVGRGGRTLHVNDLSTARGEHVVVGGGPVVPKRLADHELEGSLAKHRANLDLAGDPDALVVGRELVACQR